MKNIHFYIIAIFISSCATNSFVARDPAGVNEISRSCVDFVKGIFYKNATGLSYKRLEKKLLTYARENDQIVYGQEFKPSQEMTIHLKQLNLESGESAEMSNFIVRRINDESLPLRDQFKISLKANGNVFQGGEGIKKRLLDKSAFWRTEEKIYIDENKKEYFTYSTDTELPHEDVYRALSADTLGLERLKEVYGKKWSLEGLASELGISVSQLEKFGFKKGVNVNKEHFYVHDLGPVLFAKYAKKKSGDYDFAGDFYKDVGIALRKEGWPINTHVDVGFVEMTHKKWEENPYGFYKLMDFLYERFKFPKAHLHVGIPVSKVNKEQMTAITRIVEAKIVMKRSEEFGSKAEPLKFKSSNFTSKIGGRGVVKIEFSQWSEPFLQHNLEVRVHHNIEHGMSLLEFSTNLAINARDIRIIDLDSSVKHIPDDETQSLNESLNFIGLYLKGGEHDEIAKELFNYSKRIEEEGLITPKLRDELKKYLRSVKLSNLLEQSSIFMK